MLLFGSLVRQDIGFFETVKTGTSNAVGGSFTSAYIIIVFSESFR